MFNFNVLLIYKSPSACICHHEWGIEPHLKWDYFMLFWALKSGLVAKWMFLAQQVCPNLKKKSFTVCFGWVSTCGHWFVSMPKIHNACRAASPRLQVIYWSENYVHLCNVGGSCIYYLYIFDIKYPSSHGLCMEVPETCMGSGFNICKPSLTNQSYH